MKWYCKAAEQNYAPAQSNLAIRYFTGEGVEKDYAEVVKWWRKADEQNHAKGQHSIRINDQWRICFVWRNGNAVRVEILDYH